MAIEKRWFRYIHLHPNKIHVCRLATARRDMVLHASEDRKSQPEAQARAANRDVTRGIALACASGYDIRYPIRK